MDVATRQRSQKLRELSSSPCNSDSLIRDAFRKVKHADAVIEHRVAGEPDIEPPLIDFPKMSDELGFEGMVTLDQVVQTCQELVVRETVELRHCMHSIGTVG